MADEKKILLSSFHTSSVYAIEEQDFEPDLILSFDSHIDTNLLGYRQEVVEAIGGDRPLFYACARAATHAIFSRHFEQSKKSIITPRLALESHGAYIEKHMAKDDLGLISDSEEIISTFRLMQKKMFGLDIVTCPPKDPVSSLASTLEKSKFPVIDLDVDYFDVMQSECYTPLKGAKPNDLGNLERVLRLIRSVKPDLLTVSEATVQALENPQSNTNHLLNKLRSMGYEVEKFFVFNNDTEAYHLLRKWEDFDKALREKIGERNSATSFLEAMSDIDIGQHARAFFHSNESGGATNTGVQL